MVVARPLSASLSASFFWMSGETGLYSAKSMENLAFPCVSERSAEEYL